MACRASFKNSRIFPRPATTSADTGEVAVAIIGGGASPNGNTAIRAANPNRTYLTLFNFGPNPLRIAYTDDVSMGDEFLIPVSSSYDVDTSETVFGGGVGGATTVIFDEGSG